MNPLALVFDALTFRSETFQQLKNSPAVMVRGLQALILIALLVGLVAEGARQIERTAPRPAADAAQVADQLDRLAGPYANNPVFAAFARGSIREGILMGMEIAALPPRGGAALKPIAAGLEFLGNWFETPFQAGWLVSLFFLGILVHLGARIAGGRGTITQLLGLTALAFAPALLTIVPIALNTVDRMSTLPGLAGLASVIGLLITLWQLGIYVKAVSVAEEISLGQSIGALLLAVVIAMALALVLLLVAGLVLGPVFGLLATLARAR